MSWSEGNSTPACPQYPVAAEGISNATSMTRPPSSQPIQINAVSTLPSNPVKVGNVDCSGAVSDTDSGLGVQVGHFQSINLFEINFLNVLLYQDSLPSDATMESAQTNTYQTPSGQSKRQPLQNQQFGKPSTNANSIDLSFLSNMTPFAANKYEEIKVIGNGKLGF